MFRKFILASASPRRRELLGILGIPFEVVPSNTKEIPEPGETPVEFVARAAREKGSEVSGRIRNAIVLSADTIVSLDGMILGKLVSRDDAHGMRESWPGRAH